MANEPSEENELTLESAKDFITNRGGQVFLSEHAVQEHIQNSELYKDAKTKVGTAYKKAGQTVAQMLGLEIADNDKFEDIAEKAQAKVKELQKAKADGGKLSPEVEAQLTAAKEVAAELEAAKNELGTYKTRHFEAFKAKMIKDAIGVDRELAVPQGSSRENVERIFNSDILQKVSFEVGEDGKRYLKHEDSTYTGEAMLSKLKEIVDNSGYAMVKKEQKSGNSMPGFDTDEPAPEAIEAREKKAREAIRKAGIKDPTSLEAWKIRKKHGLPIPQVALKRWPEELK